LATRSPHRVAILVVRPATVAKRSAPPARTFLHMNVKPSKTRGEVVLKITASDEPLLASANAPRAAARPLFALDRILVPIDFSECSHKALRYAIPLAKEHAAAITLLYVVPKQYETYDYGGPNMPSLEAQMFVDGEKRLRGMIEDEVKDEVPAEQIVRTGAAVDEILAAARDLPANLIVISTHGHTGLRHMLLGSVAEQVVRRAPCPVLVVREQENDFILD
jgi:universal stress protein A